MERIFLLVVYKSRGGTREKFENRGSTTMSGKELTSIIGATG
jgi:hypothetical protein